MFSQVPLQSVPTAPPFLKIPGPMSSRIRLFPALSPALLLLIITTAGCDGGKPNTRAADGTVDAARVYRLYCLGCHGEEGKRGQGEMVLANGQTPDPVETRTVVENGRGKQMPAWKKRLTSDEITAVVEYVRTLEAKAQTP